ncbi:MAG: hypothetical protein GX591_08615 [Planctomycetes bacterium]|nr:hypothetical protein [Planctomycetota bacterium]
MNENRLKQNARITVETACGVRRGDAVLILSERTSKAPYHDDLLPIVTAMAEACTDLGAHPAILDIGRFVHSPAFKAGTPLRPLIAAIRAADVCINAVDYISFERLLRERPDEALAIDAYITASQRCFALQSHGMDRWDITAEQVAMINRRTDWLMQRIPASRTLHIASPAGTALTVGLGGATPNPFRVLVPLYGEVALVPEFGTETGTIIVDGPTQCGVRPKTELDRPPLRVDVADGCATGWDGDPVQVRRLEAFVQGASPRADHVDEVGILTTQLKANDQYWWEDGTHHSDRVHVALGNNHARDGRVHGYAHMDLEICRPTLSLDDTVIIREGVFVDANLL